MVSLQKGQKISLAKEAGAAGLREVIVGLGWDVKKKLGSFGSDYDLDASVALCQNGKVVDKHDVVYYGNLTHPSGAVRHCGDNLTGEGDGDDEQIILKLDSIPECYDKIIIFVNIYRAIKRKQDFGQVVNAYMHLVNYDGKELCRYNLSDNYNGMTAMIFGEVYRHNGEWKVNAIGQGTTDANITDVVRRFQ